MRGVIFEATYDRDLWVVRLIGFVEPGCPPGLEPKEGGEGPSRHIGSVRREEGGWLVLGGFVGLELARQGEWSMGGRLYQSRDEAAAALVAAWMARWVRVAMSGRSRRAWAEV
jgi:hypothetical protein